MDCEDQLKSNDNTITYVNPNFAARGDVIEEGVSIKGLISAKWSQIHINGQPSELKEKKVWQSSSQTYNNPALFVDACNGNTSPQLKLKLLIQNFTIRFANTEPTFPYIVEQQQPPTLIHIQSLSYETQISEVNLMYCDVRGREIGVYGAMFHVEQEDVSIKAIHGYQERTFYLRLSDGVVGPVNQTQIVREVKSQGG
ncbi:MAG: hypothetical protein EZS28_030925 [Streblomastix strix]|uniref:Uncharacterized protein n=1 Tax=Streblomastix strix TaxID=222440 RepID=A0A5J4UTR0_9EUKA|nr:MAG: hypothetical protein EZS28_030925 [Streblomastix strix]